MSNYSAHTGSSDDEKMESGLVQSPKDPDPVYTEFEGIWPDFVRHIKDNTAAYIDLGRFPLFDVGKRPLPMAINLNVAEDQRELIKRAIEERIAGNFILPHAVYVSPLLMLLSARPATPNATLGNGMVWPRTMSVVGLLRMYMTVSYLFEATPETESEALPAIVNKQQILEEHAGYVQRVCRAFYMQMDGNPHLQRIPDILRSFGGDSRPLDIRVFAEEFGRLNRTAVIEYVRGFEIQIMKFLSIPREYQMLFFTSTAQPLVAELSPELLEHIRQDEILLSRYRDTMDPGVQHLDGIEEWVRCWQGHLSLEALYNTAVFFSEQKDTEKPAGGEGVMQDGK